ncbi:MAG TPA: hypothetical protein VIK72_14530 [Clostridiaceae bacterium]
MVEVFVVTEVVAVDEELLFKGAALLHPFSEIENITAILKRTIFFMEITPILN